MRRRDTSRGKAFDQVCRQMRPDDGRMLSPYTAVAYAFAAGRIRRGSPFFLTNKPFAGTDPEIR
jgi:hypothetical protein